VAIVIENDDVSNFNGVRAGELHPAVVEVHLTLAIEQHLH
jgi:hypothetical protein